MTSEPENPPAFPHQTFERNYLNGRDYPVVRPGMTLRDHFAGQALVGLCASENNDVLDRKPVETLEDAFVRDAERRAAWCYRQADAMLRERAKDRPTTERPPRLAATDAGLNALRAMTEAYALEYGEDNVEVFDGRRLLRVLEETL